MTKIYNNTKVRKGSGENTGAITLSLSLLALAVSGILTLIVISF